MYICIQEIHKHIDSLLDQKIAQQSSEILVLKAELEILRKTHQQLISIHNKCKNQKDKISVAIQTDEVNMYVLNLLYVYACVYVCHCREISWILCIVCMCIYHAR